MTPAHWHESYRGRRVLVTGHTGFKGGWLSLWLSELGADVSGYSLAPWTDPNIFTAAGIAGRVRHTEGDVRDLTAFRRAWKACRASTWSRGPQDRTSCQASTEGPAGLWKSSPHHRPARCHSLTWARARTVQRHLPGNREGPWHNNLTE